METQPLSDRIPEGHQVEFVAGSSDFTARWRWQKDGQDLTTSNSSRLLLRHIQASDGGLYRAIALNAAGDAETISREARLTIIPTPAGPGTVDRSFLDLLGAPDKLEVRAILTLPNLRCLVVASSAQPVAAGWQQQARIYRLHADGRIDDTWPVVIAKGQTRPKKENLPTENRTITTLRWQGDKILVGGALTTWSQAGADMAVNRLLRLHATGLRDASFATPSSTSLTGEVRSIETFPTTNELLLGSTTTPFLSRLPANGASSLTSFNISNGIDARVNATRILPDGRVAVAGALGTAFRGFMLLQNNGARDASFPDFAGLDDEVLCLVPRLNSSANLAGFWLGGKFSKVQSLPQRYLTLVNQLGVVDPVFATATLPNAPVQTLALQSSDLYAGGNFTNLSPHVTKLNALTGIIDPGWHGPSITRDVLCLAIPDDDHLFVGGKSSQPHDGIVRLLTTWPAAVPQILPPASQCESAGASTSLTTEVTGSQTQAFHWYRNGQWLRTTKRPELPLAHLNGNHAGFYQIGIPLPNGLQLSAAAPVSVRAANYGGRQHYVSQANLSNQLVPDEGILSFPLANPLPAGIAAEEVRVVIALEHEDVNDLEITLERPGGLDPVVLFNQAGAGSDLDYTIFTASALRVIADYTGPFAGTYQAEDSLALRALASRIGPDGLVLHINDHGTDGIQATVLYAAVEFISGPAPTTYTQWSQAKQFPSPPNANSDQNHNGLSDLIEYALPARENIHSPLTIFQNATLQHSEWSLPAGIFLSYEASDNLNQWLPILPIANSMISRNADTGIDLVRPQFRWPSGTPPKFLRLRVSLP